MVFSDNRVLLYFPVPRGGKSSLRACRICAPESGAVFLCREAFDQSHVGQ